MCKIYFCDIFISSLASQDSCLFPHLWDVSLYSVRDRKNWMHEPYSSPGNVYRDMKKSGVEGISEALGVIRKHMPKLKKWESLDGQDMSEMIIKSIPW